MLTILSDEDLSGHSALNYTHANILQQDAKDPDE